VWTLDDTLTEETGGRRLSPSTHFWNEGALHPYYTRSFVYDGVICVAHWRVAPDRSKIPRLSSYMYAEYEMEVQEQRGFTKELRLT